MNVNILSLCLLLTASAAQDIATETSVAVAQQVPPEATAPKLAELKLIANIAPINATYRDLFAILEKARVLTATANSGTDKEYTSESLRIQDDRLTVTLPMGFSQVAFTGAPEVAYDVYYSYYHFGGQISNVTVRLGDFGRELTVSGHSHDHVTALHSHLVQELSKHSTYLGGAGFRLIGSLILLIIGFVLLQFALKHWQQPGTREFFIVLAFAIYISPFVLPWSKWFSGTAIYVENASFIVRHTAWFTFAGFIVSVLGIVMAMWRLPPRHSVHDEQTATDQGVTRGKGQVTSRKPRQSRNK